MAGSALLLLRIARTALASRARHGANGALPLNNPRCARRRAAPGWATLPLSGLPGKQGLSPGRGPAPFRAGHQGPAGRGRPGGSDTQAARRAATPEHGTSGRIRRWRAPSSARFLGAPNFSPRSTHARDHGALRLWKAAVMPSLPPSMQGAAAVPCLHRLGHGEVSGLHGEAGGPLEHFGAYVRDFPSQRTREVQIRKQPLQRRDTRKGAPGYAGPASDGSPSWLVGLAASSFTVPSCAG
jgi:hypothetical protein